MFNQSITAAIENNFSKKAVFFGPYQAEIHSKLGKLCDEKLILMKYIYANLPLSDVASVDFETLYSFVEHSLYVRENMPWGKDIPLDMFLSDVLFCRVNSEKIENHRKLLFDLAYERIKSMTNMADVVIALNYLSLEVGTYRASDYRTASPLSFMKRICGRCGEESVFTASLLRAFCIPARQIYTPRWAHCDSNHAWVEAYCDGKWHYLGACEPEPVLDKGWFNSASSRAMLLHSRVFETTRIYGEKITNEGPITTLNQTGSYAKTTRLSVFVEKGGKPMANADVHFEIINYGGFTPISILKTDMYGGVHIELGLGSVNICVTDREKYVEKLIHTGAVSDVLIHFDKAVHKLDSVEEFDTFAPVDGNTLAKSLDTETLTRHKQLFEQATKIRTEKENKVYLSNGLNLDSTQLALVDEILFKAKANGETILDFLKTTQSSHALALLETLLDKDYSDVPLAILTDHLKTSEPYAHAYDETIFKTYVLAPRIAYEELSCYKSFILGFFTEEELSNFKAQPELAWAYICKKITYYEHLEYDTLITPPEQALSLGAASPLSKKVLFVAIMRSLGIPAMVDKITSLPMYYKDGHFICPDNEKNKAARIQIVVENPDDFVYGTNWNVSVLECGTYESLHYNGKIQDFGQINLPCGQYRITTSNRLPNGNIFAKSYCFYIEENETKSIEISLRHINFEDLLLDIDINDFNLVDTNNNSVTAREALNGHLNVALWLSENEEPTEHILNELADLKDSYNELSANIVFILKQKSAMENRNITRALQLLPGAKVYFDKDFYMREPIARSLYVDPEKLPLLAITRQGLNAIYANSGYNVGTGQLILKIIKSRA